jgi:hypothetical protein
VQLALAENVAVTVQPAPFAVSPLRVYACGEEKGALNVCEPPHDPVIVSVPVDGALANEIEPDKL